MRNRLLFTGAALAAPFFTLAGPAPFLFVDATPASGIRYHNLCGAQRAEWITETLGAGAAWLDADGDGNLDLYLVNGSTLERPPGQGEPNRLFLGDGHGTFHDATEAAGVGHRGWGYGVTVGDYDNDGDPDLYVTNLGLDVLYRNRGDGTFEDVTRAAGLDNRSWGTSAAFFDMDADGDLDLYVGNYVIFDRKTVPRRGTEAAKRQGCTYWGLDVMCGPHGLQPAQDILYRNQGDGTFEDVTRSAGVWLQVPRYTLGVVAADYDNDGDTDLYVANDGVVNSLWQNRGRGRFTDMGMPSLTALSGEGAPQAGMGADFGDFTGDGWLDLVVTNFSHDLNTLYRNMRGRFFQDESHEDGMYPTAMSLSWGTGFHDFDRDGDLDLFIANGHVYPEVDDQDIGTHYRQHNHLFLNVNRKFQEVAARSGPGLALARSFRGAAFADYDNDGDMDILVTALNDDAVLLRNDTPPAGHFLQVHLVGTRSNRDGVGARATLTTKSHGKLIRERKGGGSFMSASDPRLHFGLGADTRAEVLEIQWPSGLRTTLRNVPADQALTLREGAAPPASAHPPDPPAVPR
ncbi:MAG: CRTAC1 family protein [Acidobacteriota bacterium]